MTVAQGSDAEGVQVQPLPGPLVGVVGPTASGKSALADELAVRLESAVVSVDAMQVYRGMDIGTAKTPVEERRAPLELVDLVDLGEAYSVALFQKAGRAVIDRWLDAGRTPVLCGGTGLYLDALVDEMEFPTGEAQGEARAAYEEQARREGPEALWEELRRRDPESAAAVHPHNLRRVIRALELNDQGVSYARQREALQKRPSHYQCRLWALMPDREVLYRRIDARVDAMFEAGLVEEVRGLQAAGLEEALTARQAIGYKEVLDALAGRCSWPEAKDRVKAATRRYAKRQLSWLRRDGRARPLDIDALGVEGACALILDDLAACRDSARL